MGDKRRRGSGRGKRGARSAEDNAHRSSRSRHLSPMIPVKGGYGKGERERGVEAAYEGEHGNRCFLLAPTKVLLGDGCL